MTMKQRTILEIFITQISASFKHLQKNHPKIHVQSKSSNKGQGGRKALKFHYVIKH